MARTRGYQITITGFLPANPDDIHSMARATDMINAGNSGKFSIITEELENIEFKAKYTSRPETP
jgi:hypothetical protein